MSGQILEAFMFAALNAVNEAILRSRSTDELLQRVCDAVVDGGEVCAAAVLMPDDNGYLRCVAQALPDGNERRFDLNPFVHAPSEYGQSHAGKAFREGCTCIANNILNDDQLHAWHETAKSRGISSLAAVPILLGGASIGVFLLFFSGVNAPSDVIVALLERMVANASLGLVAFERERQREDVSRMFAALSATNEAILRSTTRDELCNLVCAAAVLGDTFTCARIAFVEPDGRNLRIVAAAGRGKDTAVGILSRLNIDESQGTSIGGTAFKSGRPSISNDYISDPRPLRMRDRLRELGTRAIAAFPLFADGRPIGAFTLQSDERGAFTPERIDLLQQLADNVSFALANFDRAEQKRRADERVQYLATHDALTALPNRAAFNELLEQAIKLARRQDHSCAVLFIDLDHFKHINDTLGHAAGDELLIEVARRLRACVRDSDVVARLAGDEFVVILADIREPGQAASVARKLLAALCSAVVLGGQDCKISASIGIAVFPADGTEGEILTRHADAAMYLAKEQGKNDFRFFSFGISGASESGDGSDAAAARMVPVLASPPVQPAATSERPPKLSKLLQSS
jgi:diguanylate cyclase (GGDEF)-like protein